MKKLFILFGLFLTLSVSGQLLPGIVEGQKVVESGSSEPPAFLSADGHTDNWYMADDGVSLSGSDVTGWADQTANNYDLAVLFEHYPAMGTDGVLFHDDRMYNGSIAVSQPLSIYIVIKWPSWDNGNRVFSFRDDEGIKITMANGGPGEYRLTANSNIVSTAEILAQNTFGVLRVRLNGASSYFQLNNGTSVSIDAGTGAINYFTLCFDESNFELAELIVRNQIDSAGDQTSIMDYLDTKWSLGL